MRRRQRHGERGAVAVCDRAPTSAPGRWSAARRDRHSSPRIRTERGAAVVEFGLIAPLLLLLFFGVIDYSYMLNRDTMLNNSVRDAARTASLGGSYAEIENTLVSELKTAGIPTTSPRTVVTIDCIKTDGTPCAVNHVASNYDAAISSGATAIVRVQYHYGWITPLPSLVAGNSITLAQETQMRVE